MSFSEYSVRRQLLAKNLPPHAVAIIPAAIEQRRNGDATYRFRQDSDFYYLTGFDEPDAVLIVFAGQEGESFLFNRPRNPAQEQWTGKILGQEAAPALLGVQQAFDSATFPQRLPELLAQKTTVYLPLGRYPLYDKAVWEAIQSLKGEIRRGVAGPQSVADLDPLLSEMRLLKSDTEIALMQKAADISVLGHQQAMQMCTSLRWEYELEAELVGAFLRQGARGLAYEPIVGAGENSCILHYSANNQPLTSGQMVLIDAAAEFGNYAADITRTFPVNGRFQGEQRAIYELVLKAQRAGISCIKPGISWAFIQQTMVRILTIGLCDLGLLKGNVDDLIEQGAYKVFYMHNSGHWLGLDVHDCGQYKIRGEWRTLQPGMVLTVEPGIYIQASTPHVDPRWWNIGVRIEDDILVTADGHRNLTQALPTSIHDIEACMRG